MCKLFESKASISKEANKKLCEQPILPPINSAHEGSPLLMGANGDPANRISNNPFLNSLHALARNQNWSLPGSVKNNGFIAANDLQQRYFIFWSASGVVYAIELNEHNSVKSNPKIFILSNESNLRALLINNDSLIELNEHHCCIVM